jgi:uncharacterized protein (DUF1499 family)
MKKNLCGLCALSVAGGFLALALLALAGPLYRLDLLELGQAFSLLRWAAYLGIASIILIIGYSIWRRPKGRFAGALAVSALAGVCAIAIPWSQMQTARSVPPIHDISTDLENPPAFVDIVALRKDAPNPPEYAGPDAARQQRQAYPDIQPLILNAPLDEVYQSAQEIVHALGWRLVSAETEQWQARVEATDTTFWFGFKDDVVVRLQYAGNVTQVDVRSKSRVGKGDVGKNAERIREFFRVLEEEVGQN